MNPIRRPTRVIHIEAAVPALVKARGLVEQFQMMIRTKDDTELRAWIGDAMASPIASLAVGIRADQRPWLPPLQNPGPMVRQRARSPNSSWSNARCMVVPTRPDQSATYRSAMTGNIFEIASQPLSDAD
jgi:hypothetical protein